MNIIGFFTEGIIGVKYGKRGFFSRPNEIELNWKLGDKDKRNSEEEVRGKGTGENFKFDLKIKL